jgi:hypothetical protein
MRDEMHFHGEELRQHKLKGMVLKHFVLVFHPADYRTLEQMTEEAQRRIPTFIIEQTISACATEAARRWRESSDARHTEFELNPS